MTFFHTISTSIESLKGPPSSGDVYLTSISCSILNEIGWKFTNCGCYVTAVLKPKTLCDTFMEGKEEEEENPFAMRFASP